MNEHFRCPVAAARGMGVSAWIDRCNSGLILSEPTASKTWPTSSDCAGRGGDRLRCLLQRRAWTASAQKALTARSRPAAAQRPAAAAGTGPVLNLVYNSPGPSLPPVQAEADQRELGKHPGMVSLAHLFVLANMPIQRFGSMR